MKFNLDDYELVEDRLKAFWKDNPNGCITTDVVHITDDGSCVTIKAYIHNDDGNLVATGIAQETQGQGGFANKDAWVENCETSAIGRGLANWKYQGSNKKRPSQQEMSKTQDTKKKPPLKTAPSKPVKELKVQTSMKNLVFNMCDENKEFAKTTYEYAYNKVTIGGATKDIESWDTGTQGKFLDEAEKFVMKYKDEGSKMKPWEDKTVEEKVGSVFTLKEGDEMADIPSGAWENDPMSDPQANFMDTLINECIDKGGAAETVAQEAKALVNSGEMTKKIASQWIDKLKTAKS